MSIGDFLRSDTPARYLQARQQKYPPIYQTDASAWQALFRVALDLSTPKLRRFAQNGVIVSGEVGELTPSAYVTRRGRGYVIEMHSGMMRLVYSAARAITASDSGRFRDDKSPALTLADVAAQIADLFSNYEKYNKATAQLFFATSFQRGWAEVITESAERFLLMHELAHIHNGDLALWRNFADGGGDGPARESAADATACQWMVDYLLHPDPKGPQRQMLYAGAEFGLRVRMAMETVGMRFNKTHPPAGNRIVAMREKLRSTAGSRTFYAIANTSIAFDQMWRAIELILRKMEPVFAPNLDDVLAGLRTLTVELLRAGRDAIQISDVPGQSREQPTFGPTNEVQQAIVKAARENYRDLSPELRAAVTQHAGDVFEPGSVEYSLFLALLALSNLQNTTPGRTP
jgi:hypothetical protein